MSRTFSYITLACKNGEATSIARALLEKRLIACAKFMSVNSMYWWGGEITDDSETLLVMETTEDNFDSIETEVKKLHSYDTFVLSQIPMNRVNDKAAAWLADELRKAD